MARLRRQTIGLEDLVDELDRERAYFAEQALLDPLTGLANRRAIERGLQSALQSRRRCGVVLTDIDNFKDVNDLFGHPVGDVVLQRI